jgi:hypothetical protein
MEDERNKAAKEINTNNAGNPNRIWESANPTM